jgi:hypothetical protein
MTANLQTQLSKALSPYTDADGPYIDLGVLQDALPAHRWDCVLLGQGVNRKIPVKRLPLLGRKVQANRIVVLISSLAEWLHHYNDARGPQGLQVVRSALDGLQLAQRQYETGLKQLREETRLKWGEPRGRKPRPKPAKQTKPPVVTSAALFGVWK